MSDRSVKVKLYDEVCKVIDTQFKPLSDETDSEILSNIIKNHLEPIRKTLLSYMLSKHRQNVILQYNYLLSFPI